MTGFVTGGAAIAGPSPRPPSLLDLLFPPAQKPAAPVAPAAAPTSFTAADAVVDRVPLFESPGVPLAGGRTLSNPTSEGMSLVFLVKQNQGEWLQVQIPSRPNGATAWIRRSDVFLRTVPNHIVIDLGARRLTVLRGAQPLGQFPVAIGAPGRPTPTGDFYVDAVVHLARDTGAYGAGQLSVTAFSDVYQTFGGGPGEIAIHGTNDPALIGGTVSHGCVRMLNADWLQVADLAPTGTPVSIVG
jgi:lipoprotein-anchoring transpeptidase ErfK/SrfK